MELEPLGPIEAGTYFIDPDGDASTPLRVVYEVPAEGWSNWIGAAKFSDAGHVGFSITTVVEPGDSTGATTIRGPIRRSGRVSTTSLLR